MFCVRGFHDARCLAGIVRQKHQDIDATLEQLVDLAKLQVIVAIGGTGDDGTSEFAGALLKFFEVGLPALAFLVFLDKLEKLEGFELLREEASEAQSCSEILVTKVN